MNTPSTKGAPPTFGLANLDQVPLDAVHGPILAAAQKLCGGPATFRRRIIAEARDLVALAQISGRLQIHWLDLSAGLRAKVELEAPIPCLPDPSRPLHVAERCVLGLLYPEQAVFLPQPGYAFVRILHPRAVWHSNVAGDEHRNHDQPLCLGASIAAGMPLKEIVLMAYGALTLQTTQFSLLDPAGVLNPAAAVWWQQNINRIPLTREPFLRERQA